MVLQNGNDDQVLQKAFNKAISTPTRAGFFQDAAPANERAGSLFWHRVKEIRMGARDGKWVRFVDLDVALVVLHFWAYITPNFSMWCPAWAVVGFVM
jgi:hypothetical protein